MVVVFQTVLILMMSAFKKNRVTALKRKVLVIERKWKEFFGLAKERLGGYQQGLAL